MIKIDAKAAEWAAICEGIKADMKSGKLVSFHGALRTREEIASAERTEGGYRFR